MPDGNTAPDVLPPEEDVFTLKPSREEQRRLQSRAYEESYATWFAALPASQQAFLKSQGLHKPIIERPNFRNSGHFDDPSDSQEASVGDAATLPADLEPMSESEHAQLEAAFLQALAWSAQAGSLVEMGRRLTVMLHLYKPALLRGLQLEIQQDLEVEFQATRNKRGIDVEPERIGESFGCVIEWVTRGNSLSQWGHRLMAALYVTRPAAIDDLTLEGIGEKNSKTRQAIDKLVQDFRDTFNGIKSAAMRTDETRERCRLAQLHRA